MFSQTETHAALHDIQQGRPVPAQYRDYLIARGLAQLAAIDAPATAGNAELNLTEAGEACLRDRCV